MDPKKPVKAPSTDEDVAALLDNIPEIGGPEGAEPTRFGDWEQNGRCTDF